MFRLLYFQALLQALFPGLVSKLHFYTLLPSYTSMPHFQYLLFVFTSKLFHAQQFWVSSLYLHDLLSDFDHHALLPVSTSKTYFLSLLPGFGHELAIRLSDIGVETFAGCLFADGPGAKRLKERKNERLHVVQMDVTSEEQVEQVLQEVENKRGNNGKLVRTKESIMVSRI